MKSSPNTTVIEITHTAGHKTYKRVRPTHAFTSLLRYRKAFGSKSAKFV